MRGRIVVSVVVLGLLSASASGSGVTRFSEAAGVVTIAHPRHRAELSSDGVSFVPAAGPRWGWQLRSVSAGGQDVALRHCADPTLREREHVVEYDRGAAIERYVPRKRSIEQQFVIRERLAAGDVVIDGVVSTRGRFASTPRGWVWTDEKGSVSLGHVTVYDANGCRVAASMDAGPGWTKITVSGEALANAAYPVTIDPEIGTNDFRISTMGTDGDDDSDTYLPAVAYNSLNNEYLVVWQGTDDLLEQEIWAQRVAGNGTIIGSEFRVSTMGTVATGFHANAPDVVYNATANEYLVVWRGDDNVLPNYDNDNEIFGQRINAATGAEIGTDFRISQMGPNNGVNLSYNADNPSVAWDSTNNQYLVVWQGSDEVTGLVEGELEIWGRLVSAAGAVLSANDIRISETTPDGSFFRNAFNAAVAFDSINSRYLVVWTSDDDPALADNELEVFGQFLTTAGADFGTDFRISDMGPNGDFNFGAQTPAIVFNANSGEFLVVWSGADTTPGVGEVEVWGQRIAAATGVEVGTNDFRISEMGPDGSTAFGGNTPSVAYDPVTQQYLVVWTGADVVQNDVEVWGQRLSSTGAAVGRSDYRLSEVAGPVPTYQAGDADVAAGPSSQMLVIWRATDQSFLIATEQEVFGQRFSMVNGVPAVTLPSGTLNYTEGGPATVIDAAATLTDDSEDFATGSLTVEYTANGTAADRLTIRNEGAGAGQIGVSGSNVTYGGIVMGTYSGGTGLTPLVVTFGDQAIPAAGQALMRNITFSNVSATPSGAARTVQFTVNDGDGQSGTALKTINVILIVDAPLGFAATATSTSQVALSWSAVGGATGYEIHRSSLAAPFSLLTTTSAIATAYNDTPLSANTTYLYKVRTLEGTAPSPFTPVDPATTVIFTDPTLTIGVTPIKAVHITELRTAVNAMRAAAGLGAASFSDSSLAAGNSIRAVHITELRAALDLARSTIGLTAIIYTDPTITIDSTTAKRAHVTDLRAGTQ